MMDWVVRLGLGYVFAQVTVLVAGLGLLWWFKCNPPD